MNNIVLRREKQVSTRIPGTPRSELRMLAKLMGVKRGRNTDDTIRNLKDAGYQFIPA